MKVIGARESQSSLTLTVELSVGEDRLKTHQPRGILIRQLLVQGLVLKDFHETLSREPGG